MPSDAPTALEAMERVKASAIENGGRLTPSAILDIQGAIDALAASAEPSLDLMTLAAKALLDWYDTTHGSEFGHDHHCSVREVDDVTDACTCGWSAFVRADRLREAGGAGR